MYSENFKSNSYSLCPTEVNRPQGERHVLPDVWDYLLNPTTATGSMAPPTFLEQGYGEGD